MINFLKGSIGVPEGMFTNMSFSRIEELYKKEMAKLQGDFSKRVEFERKMKETHDLNIQQPFPDSEEGIPTKERAEVKKEETLAQKIGAVKRKKSIATKPKAKRPRIEEVEKENESEPEPSEPIAAPHVEQQKQAEQGKIIRRCNRADLEEMYKVGLSLYGEVLKGAEMSLIKMAMEYLCMMFDLVKVEHIIKDVHHENGFKSIDNWMLFERCGVYVITVDKSFHEYYLIDKVYDHSKMKLERMLKAKLVCPKGSEMARIVIRRTINQSVGLDPNLGN
ncbi:hypothetical protein L6452_01438 [Arctium lappa]|uniref:Uncharacterized protein n=1 Tax=Arctium lappa TaxID=4217 RepID=A0ACB9FGP0_ARCLA|nr:hypothetical protein L6452_01438 [Arctium lappa]